MRYIVYRTDFCVNCLKSGGCLSSWGRDGKIGWERESRVKEGRGQDETESRATRSGVNGGGQRADPRVPGMSGESRGTDFECDRGRGAARAPTARGANGERSH